MKHKIEKSEKEINVGRLGEAIATRYLESRGFEILDRNFLKKWGEIDIVAKKEGVLRFVEVKSVSRNTISHETTGDYAPEENVHPEKLKRLSRAIQSYLLERNVSEDTEWQIDVLAVFLDVSGKKAKVRITENIVVC